MDHGRTSRTEPASAQATSLQFATAVRTLAQAARACELVVPSFRSPPRVDGVDRTLRRRADGGVTVSVRLRGRPWAAVLADMIDGTLATNRLAGSTAAPARSAMWAAVERAGLIEHQPVDGSGRAAGRGSDARRRLHAVTDAHAAA